MKKKTNPYLLTLLLTLGLFLAGQASFAQCDLKFDYKVDNSSLGKNDGKITVVFEGSSTTPICVLFDHSGKSPQLLMDVQQTTDAVNRTVVFHNLSARKYLIRVNQEGCEYIVIGGKSGITVGTKK